MSEITRFEVIDHRGDGKGRMLVIRGAKIETSLQDDGRTLKVFVTDAAAAPRQDDYEPGLRVSRIVEGLDRIDGTGDPARMHSQYRRYWPADLQFLASAVESLRSRLDAWEEIEATIDEHRALTERVEFLEGVRAAKRSSVAKSPNKL